MTRTTPAPILGNSLIACLALSVHLFLDVAVNKRFRTLNEPIVGISLSALGRILLPQKTRRLRGSNESWLVGVRHPTPFALEATKTSDSRLIRRGRKFGSRNPILTEHRLGAPNVWVQEAGSRQLPPDPGRTSLLEVLLLTTYHQSLCFIQHFHRLVESKREWLL